MEHRITLNAIAHIRSSFPEKFGIPRQGGLADTGMYRRSVGWKSIPISGSCGSFQRL